MSMKIISGLLLGVILIVGMLTFRPVAAGPKGVVWVPAFAGMTVGAGMTVSAGMTVGAGMTVSAGMTEHAGMTSVERAELLSALLPLGLTYGGSTTPRLMITRSDADGDGVADSVDNCPNYWNPEQYDADEDGIGNVCDECTDQDGDGFGDPGFPTNTCLEDNCPGFANPDQLDSDGDGIGDPCEGLECGDVDGDSVISVADLVLTTGYMWQGSKSPVSMDIANTGGCNGVNLWDLVYTYSEFYPWWYDCYGPTDCPPVPAGVFSLDSVDGLYAPDTLATGRVITLYLRLTGSDSLSFSGLSNGFHVYSNSGAEWGGTIATDLVDLGTLTYFNHGSMHLLSMTGSGADTVSLGYWEMGADMGIPPLFDSVTHAIEIGPIPHEYSGGEICLDSCWYPPGGEWMWATEGSDGDPYLPSWDGPHCFTIYNCCLIRGDIDNNGSEPDIADLIFMVTYMFQEGPRPPCMTAVDINGDELPEPDIADLIYLVTFMFQDGPPPVACPE